MADEDDPEGLRGKPTTPALLLTPGGDVESRFSQAATLPDSAPRAAGLASEPRSIEKLLDPLDDLSFRERYAEDKLLGEGGMGEVWLYKDEQIGRSVAMKVMRPEQLGSQTSRARFVREARVQGQLEHPAMVPVYDLGVTPEGATYFTMKRVRGVTLEQIITRLRDRDPQTRERFSRRRLLSDFSSVCLAIQFAHERGVLHRDLKPGNVMLGDFGEVYVLDWGLAKVQETPDFEPEETLDVTSEPDSDTMPGAMLGTPGYMSPEQFSETSSELTPASDVYALGAILFELLTLQELHARTTVQAVMSSTLMGVDARPSVRAPDAEVPPELEALCVAATRTDPKTRIGSARALQDAIERYLDGERDSAQRTQMASAHARRAAEAAARARGEGGSLDDRRTAMREVGRALALDPDNEAALESMVGLLTEPPSELPPEVRVELSRAKQDRTRWVSKLGGMSYSGLLLLIPFFVWSGVRDWGLFALFYAFGLTSAGLSFYAAFRGDPRDRIVLSVMVISNLGFAMTCLVFGAFIITPTVVAVNTAAYAIYLDRKHRFFCISVGVVCVLLPVLADLADLNPASYAFVQGGMLIRPVAIELPRVPTYVFLGLTSVASVIAAGVVVSKVRDALGAAERHLYLYTWHLREFVPQAARGATDPTVDSDVRARHSRAARRGGARRRNESA